MPSVVNRAPWGLVVLVATLIYVPVSAPAEGVPLPGLSTSASIVRDSNHVPHLCAGTERDAFVLLGYVHAEDRLFQMDSQRRKFSGDLAELVGPEALGSDVEFRSFGLRRSAEASWAAYVEGGLTSSTEALQAYADGVNAYLAENPLPPEYAALELTSARPWTVIDSLTILKGILLELSFDLSDLERSVAAAAYQEAGDRGGFDGMALLFDDVARFAPFDPTVSIPAAVPAAVEGRGSYTAPAPAVTKLARTTRDRLANVPSLARALRPEKRDVGSNWWLVDGAHSASGRAMLANDPHLGLGTPSTFHEAHLVVSADARCGLPEDPGGEATASTLDANGVALPGVPGLVQGCNQRICWGSTVNPVDVTDIYLETLVVDAESGVPTHTIFEGTPEPLTVLPQSFRTNQIGDGRLDHLEPVSVDPSEGGSTLLVPRRNGGPLLTTDLSAQPAIGLSVQYTGWSGSTEVEAFLGIMGAGSLAEFEDALEFFDTGSQNWAYADVDGNIAYVASGELPIREDLQELGAPDGGVPPFMIRDGAHDLRHEWAPVTQPQPHQSLGFEVLPASEMPRLVNPPSGYIVNANNDPAGATLDNDLLNQTRPGGGVLYLGTDYSSLRIGRIDRLLRDVLAEGQKATLGDMKRIQGNHQMLDAELLLPFLIKAFANGSAEGAPAELRALTAEPAIAEAVARLADWDFSTPTGLPQGYDPGDDPDRLPEPGAEEIRASVAATLWSTFRGRLIERVLVNLLALGIEEDSIIWNYRSVAHLLSTFEATGGVGASGLSFFETGLDLEPEQERDWILLASLGSALELLAGDAFAEAFGGSTDLNDYRWGRLHRITFRHLLGEPFSVPGAAGFEHLGEALEGLPRSGGYEVVDASGHFVLARGSNDFLFNGGAARRFVGVLDPAGIRAEQILPGGQSGQLGHPHYASQLGRWLTVDYHPMLLDPAAIAADTASELRFEPSACGSSETTLCFQGERFAATLAWRSPDRGAGAGRVVPGGTDASGNFYFFTPDNWEMLVKVLDGCGVNGHYWVYASGASDVEWELEVEDLRTEARWSVSNPLGRRSPAITDTAAFPCQAP